MLEIMLILQITQFPLLLRSKTPILGLCLFFALAVTSSAVPRPVNVRVNRWLMVRQNQGQVMFDRQGTQRSSRSGDRLEAVGDGVITGQRSTAVLEVDTGIGFIQVAENTHIRVRSLAYAPDNGRITVLEVPYGQARLQLRPFTHRGSTLEIFTPAGVSAVRGTDFGVSIQPNGKTGLATLSGAVTATAQGRSVFVPGGFQNFTLPGEAPSAAVPLRDSTELRYQLERRIQAGVRSLRFVGKVDPVNLVLVGSKPQTTDRNGEFSLLLSAVSRQSLQITVVTPLGRRQVHDVLIQL
jgi:hypothetical protein